MSGGKSGTTTQSVSIPPEVLARYNSVNARAENLASRPFQQYTGQFVEPMNQQQYGGVDSINRSVEGINPAFNTSHQQLTDSLNLSNNMLMGGYQLSNNAYNLNQPYLTQGLAQGQTAYGNANAIMQNALSGVSNLTQNANPQLFAGLGTALGAYGQASPMYQSARDQANAAFTQGSNQMGRSEGYLNNAISQGQQYGNLAYNAMAGANQASQPMLGSAADYTVGGIGAASPMMGAAENYLAGGTQDVNAQDFGQAQINKYMSPYMRNVVEAQQKLQLQENAAQRNALNSQAIGAGAFGGDRAGVAQANLARQQSLANQATLGNILQQGYGQAANMFQQQQGVDLAARQANRAAQQFGSQQAANLAQQRFGQQMQTGSQLAGLAGQQFQQAIGQGQAVAGLGNQMYQQGLGAAGQAASLGQGMYGMGMGVSQNTQNIGQGMFGMGSQMGNMQQATGQTMFNQGAQQAGMQQGLGSAMYGMGLQNAGLTQNTGQQLYNMGQQQANMQNMFGQNMYAMGSNAATTNAALAQQQQQALLNSGQAQIGAGTLMQQTNQAQKTAEYQQFLQERGYDFQVAQFLANIAMGTGALSGSTTTTTSPMPFMSDRQTKKDVKEIGTTHDGLPIYSFKYKQGDDLPRIGVMADEVRAKHPDAVSRHGGVDAVDYEKVADRASMGGGVMPSRAGQGYAPGGVVSDQDLAAIIAMQKQFLGPHGQGGLYGQSQHNLPGGKGIVPQNAVHVAKLQTAGPPPRLPESGLAQGAAALEKAEGTYDKLFGNKGLLTSQGAPASVYRKLTGGSQQQPSGAPTQPSAAPAQPQQGGVVPSSGGTARDKGIVQNFSQKNADAAPVMGGVMPDTRLAADMEAPSLPKELDEDLLGSFTAARGGVVPHRAGGGRLNEDVLPYQSEAGYGPEDVNEKESGKEIELMKPGQTPGSGGSGSGGLGSIASTVGSVGTIAKAGATLAEALPAIFAALPFSDERVKHDMERVGKLDNGQPVYKYRIGDGPAQLGLSAQNVSKYGDPSAVYRDQDGFLHLDYERAAKNYGGGIRPAFEGGGEAKRDNLRDYYNYIVSKGEPEHVAAGMVGNIAKESAGRADAWGDNNNSFGLFQKNIRGELPAFRQWAETNQRDMNDPYAQIDHVLDQMRGAHSKTYQQMLDANDPAKAAYAFAVGYERPVPATANYEGRMNVARQYYGGIDPNAVEEHINANYPKDGQRRSVAPAVYENGKTTISGEPERTGLAAFLPENYRTGKQFESIGDYLTDRQFVRPLLSGLAGMAQSKSHYFLPAFMEGLGAAAAADASGERAQQEISASKANELFTLGQAANQAIFQVGDVTYVRLANGDVVTLDKWITNQQPTMGGDSAAQTARAIYARKTGSQPQDVSSTPSMPFSGSNAPSSAGISIPSFLTYDNDVIDRAKQDLTSSTGMNNPGFREEANRQRQRIVAGAEAARNIAPIVTKMSQNIADSLAVTGLTSTGPGTNTIAPIVGQLNALTKRFGFTVDFGNVDDIRAKADKYNAMISALAAQGVGQESLGALQRLYSAMPDPNMPRNTQAEIAAELLVFNKKDQHREAFMRKYEKDAGMAPAGAGEMFESKNGQKYLAAVDLVKDAMLKQPELYNLMMSGRVPPAKIEQAFKAYAERQGKTYYPGMSVFFTK